MLSGRLFALAPVVAVSLACWAASGLGCATVTQEDPPSRLDPGAGGGGSGPLPPGGPELGGAGGGPSGAGGNVVIIAAGGQGSGQAGGPVASAGSAGQAGAQGGAAGGGGASAPDAGGTQPALLLSEDFEDFQPEDAGWSTSDDADWEITTDSDVEGNVYVQNEANTNTPLFARVGDTSWTDVIVEADMKVLEFDGSSSSYMAGLCVRVSDEENFYLVGIRSNDDTVGLRRFVEDGENVIQSDFDQADTGVWYRLRVEAIGSSISAYLDDELMFSTQDATHPSGNIALCTVRTSAAFDNLRVTRP